jgi:hypothetical protein
MFHLPCAWGRWTQCASLACTTVLALLAHSNDTLATTTTYIWPGTVTFVQNNPGVSLGDSFTVTFAYSDTMALQSSSVNSADFVLPANSLSLAIDGSTFTVSSGFFEINENVGTGGTVFPAVVADFFGITGTGSFSGPLAAKEALRK